MDVSSEETPLHLVYMDDCYYLVAWNDKHESTTNYRVDRMLNIDVSGRRCNEQ